MCEVKTTFYPFAFWLCFIKMKLFPRKSLELATVSICSGKYKIISVYSDNQF